MASQISSLTIVYSTVYSGADERKHQSSTSLAFVRGIHRWPVNSPHKGQVTRKMFPFDDVIRKVDSRNQWPRHRASLILWTSAYNELQRSLLWNLCDNPAITLQTGLLKVVYKIKNIIHMAPKFAKKKCNVRLENDSTILSITHNYLSFLSIEMNYISSECRVWTSDYNHINT